MIKIQASSCVRCLFVAIAVSMLSGCFQGNDQKASIETCIDSSDQKCTQGHSSNSGVQMETDVPPAIEGQVGEGQVAEDSKSSFFDGPRLLLFVIFAFLAASGYQLLKIFRPAIDRGSRIKNKESSFPAPGTQSTFTRIDSSSSNRLQAKPVKPRAGEVHQVPRVEREPINLAPQVEVQSDPVVELGPEQAHARIRPSLAPVENLVSQENLSALDEISSRKIIKPQQIGDPSSFAKKNWWDPKVEWCQLSPLGMTGDVTCDVGTVGSLAVAAVSLRGNKHKVDAKPCQDAFNVQAAKDKSGHEYVVSVLCDGMSSASYSHYGARRTSQVLSDGFCRMIEVADTADLELVNGSMLSILEECKRKLMPKENNSFGASGVDLSKAQESDFNTTVTFLIARASPGQTNSKAIVGCIGDSPIFVLRTEKSEWEQIGVLDSTDELVNPATAAFPGSITFAVNEIDLQKDDVLVAMSDGVGNFIRVGGNQTILGNYLADQWSRPVNTATFINDVSFDLKSADDDRTVVAIWQRM